MKIGIFTQEKLIIIFSQKAQIGIAPYIGNYGDLHTWLMFKTDHNPETTNAITYTPYLDFFIKHI